MKIVASILLVSACLVTSAQEVYSTKAGAIRGYDPVAYFTDNEPVKGSEQYTYNWNGATWYFSSQENLNAFKEEPEKYAPQFGGYCAYAVGNGYTYEADPRAWRIVDGKLYLNYDKEVQKMWEAKQDHYIEEAKKNWPKLKGKN